MPRKKSLKPVETFEEVEVETPRKNPRSRMFLLIIAVVLILGLLIWKNKSLFIVATVDNQPIWRPVFEQKMLSQVGTSTLNSLVDEQILLNEAARKNITIPPQELTAKIEDIKKTLPPGTTLEAALTERNLTMKDFERNLTLQLTVEKIIASLPKPTATEITTFVEKNKESLTATDEAGLSVEATQAILNQKFQTLFQDLQKKAKVTRFL